MDLQVFNNGQIDLPVKEVDGVMMFDAEQSAIGLGISLEKNGAEYVRWERVRKYLNSPQVEKGDFITESQFYKLAMKANNPVAEKFQDWVTSEVLPTIRKHGAYMTDQKAAAIVTDKNALADLLQQAAYQLKEKDVKIERLTAELEVSSKKATYLDLIVETKDGMTATQVAQDYGLSAKKFNALLHALGVQRKVNEQWILYAKYQGKGYIASKTFTYTDSTGKNHAKINTVWTQKGRLFLYELLKANGILPLIEREG